MTPYYADDLVTIYHGDCREILPFVPGADLLLTDPPYGIGLWSSTGGNSIRSSEAKTANGWDVRPPDDLLRLAVASARLAVIWGGNYLAGALGAFRSPLVWDKRIRGMHFADGELAWTNFDFGTLRIFELRPQDSEREGDRSHPTQKPVELMRWCIALSKTTGTVLDPFMGSGSTLVAAKSLGRRAIGIEIEERYCEIAANRCRQEVLGLGA